MNKYEITASIGLISFAIAVGYLVASSWITVPLWWSIWAYSSAGTVLTVGLVAIFKSKSHRGG